MKNKFDTSINIEICLLRRVDYFAKILSITRQAVILKVLSHFIKRSRFGIFIKGGTVGYQLKNRNYKKVTLHLDSRELEIFKQVRVVTLLSTSYVFYIAMDLFGDKLFNKAKKSPRISKIILNYLYEGSYPEYDLFLRKTLALSRYRLPFT
jgi:hypothetical protein